MFSFHFCRQTNVDNDLKKLLDTTVVEKNTHFRVDFLLVQYLCCTHELYCCIQTAHNNVCNDTNAIKLAPSAGHLLQQRLVSLNVCFILRTKHI